jgi:hypothetical protein
MRVPFKTETDAFRVAGVLGLLAGISVVVGILSTRAYGIVVFAAGIAAGVVFELAGRERSESSLHEASHPADGRAGRRRLLVVTGGQLGGDELRRELFEAGGDDFELDVLMPIVASRSHALSGDVDREREEARTRLRGSLAWAAAQGFNASGEVGDPDLLLAIEDELRRVGADELVVVTYPEERNSWLANRMLGHLRRELEIPVREIAVGRSPGDPAE